MSLQKMWNFRPSLMGAFGLCIGIAVPVLAFFNVQIPFPSIVGDDRADTTVNAAVAINVVANDSDPDGSLDYTQLTIVDPPAHGTVAVNPSTGECTYAPAEDYAGTDKFSYRIRDDEGVVSNIGYVTIRIAAAATGK